MGAIASSRKKAQPARSVQTSRPRLELVPTPAPTRGFMGTVAVCVALFVGAFGAVFMLNNQMVATAWEIQQAQKELTAVSAKEATLEDQVVYAATPAALRDKAEALGLVQAESVLHLDVATGAVINPSETQNGN